MSRERQKGEAVCGRITLHTSGKEVARRFRIPEPTLFEARYNIAPTQDITTVRATDAGRQLSMFRWGLIPSWSKDMAIGYKLINARAETVKDKPSFRSAFKQRRCEARNAQLD
jgi:putative SOS response-associated peptidase YedK